MIGKLLKELRQRGLDEIADHLMVQKPRKIRSMAMEHRSKHRFPVENLSLVIGENTFPVQDINSDGVSFLVGEGDRFSIGGELEQMVICLAPEVCIPGITRHVSPLAKGAFPGECEDASAVCGVEFDPVWKRDLMVKLEVAIDWFISGQA